MQHGYITALSKSNFLYNFPFYITLTTTTRPAYIPNIHMRIISYDAKTTLSLGIPWMSSKNVHHKEQQVALTIFLLALIGHIMLNSVST